MNEERFAIYHRPGGRFVVRPWEGVEEDLWCLLGFDYTMESARALSESLERDHRAQREIQP